MAITGSTGHKLVLDIYGLIGATEDQSMKLPIVLHKSDQVITELGQFYGYVHRQISVISTTAADVETSVNVGSKFYDTSPIVKTYTLANTWLSKYAVANGTLASGSKSKTITETGSGAPRVTVASFSVTTDGTSAYATGINVHGFGFSELTKQSAGVLAKIKAYSVTGIYAAPPEEGAGFSLFDAEMPCSAYLMKYLVCNNANAIGFRTLTRVSFPLVGTGTSS